MYLRYEKQDVSESLTTCISGAELQATQIRRLACFDVSEDAHIIRWREWVEYIDHIVFIIV
jgi:hypothetical protein